MERLKFSYLGNYAINIVMVIALLIIRGLEIDAPEVVKYLNHAICFMGVLMVINLWMNAFIADDNYKGVGILNPYITLVFTVALFAIECMTVYYSIFGHEAFFLPSVIATCLWAIAFLLTARINRFIAKPAPTEAPN
jgi:hypothetical protein